MKYIVFALIIFCFGISFTNAQTTADEEDFQSWNDVQLTIPVNKRVDFIVTGTLRFGDNVQELVDRRIGGALNFKVNNWLSIQPGYTNIITTPVVGSRRNENRLSLAATYKF